MADALTADLLVIGGGINGAGIAADAAGRGARVVLAEMGDLAQGTSSASSKLIHGGLRYLEHYEFRLVREALAEREVLLARAPHIIWPLRFVLPHVPSLRPRWMLRAGLFLYDHLYRRKAIPGSRSINLATEPAGKPLVEGLTRGFAYWDCWVDDARLVVLNARAAADRGAEILTRTRVAAVAPAEDGAGWRAELVDAASGRKRLVTARALVNAAGPWVDGVARMVGSGGRPGHNAPPKVRLVKGSHIVVPRISGADDAYLMQNADGRVVFALPYEGDFTLIGTTDVPFEGDPAGAAISEDEIGYLLDVTRRFFRSCPVRADVAWSYAGVRPLYDDGSDNPSAVTRDYKIDLDAGTDRPPLLTVYGGKVTTYRRLAEEAVDRLAPHLGLTRGPWTAALPLPGGDIPRGDFDTFVAELTRAHSGLAPGFLHRLARRHGTATATILADARRPADLGVDLGAGLTEAEVRYLVRAEWARSADDVLWRRTKCGLHMTAPQRDAATRRIEALLK